MWLEKKIVDESPKRTSLSVLWYCTKPNVNIKNLIIHFSFDISNVNVQKKCAINELALSTCPLWKSPLITARGKTLSNKEWNNRNIWKLGQIVKQERIIKSN